MARGRKITAGKFRITVWANHTTTCLKKEDNTGEVGCKCIRWIQWQEGSKQPRRSTGAWTWPKAMEIAQAQLEELAGSQSAKGEAKRTTLREAVDLYMEWRTNERTNNQIYKHMTNRLMEFCQKKGIKFLDEVQPSVLTQFKFALPFRNHLRGSSSMKIHWMCMTAFFSWVTNQRLVGINPLPRGPENTVLAGQTPVVPFTDEDIRKLHQAIDQMEGDYWTGEFRHRMHMVLRLMEHSGMAIRDTLMLKRETLHRCMIVSKRQKTKKDFCVPLPQWLLSELQSLRCDNPEYFFRYTGRWGQPVLEKTAVNWYEGRFKEIFDAAKVKGTSHVFRHTAISQWLAQGIPLGEVAIMSGDSEAQIRKTYWHLLDKTQHRVAEQMTAMWQRLGLDAAGNPVQGSPTSIN